MNRRIITPVAKLCVLAAAGCGLYVLWHKGVSHHQEKADQARHDRDDAGRRERVDHELILKHGRGRAADASADDRPRADEPHVRRCAPVT